MPFGKTMAIRINFLPWRTQQAAEARRHFLSLTGMTAALAGALILLMYVYYAAQISQQQTRNQFLNAAIQRLDIDITEIGRLREQIQGVLLRKRTIESMQVDRARAVFLLEQIARQTPEGIYLRSLTQRGLQVSVVGYAQSDAKVSTFMRNLDTTPGIVDARLNEIKAVTANARRLAEFTLEFSLQPNVALGTASSATPGAPAIQNAPTKAAS